MRELADDSPWKRAEVRELLEELTGKNGISSQEIANRINERFGTKLTRNAIIGRVTRAKLPRPQGISGNGSVTRRAQPLEKTNDHTPRPAPKKPKPHRFFQVPQVTPQKEASGSGAAHWLDQPGGRRIEMMELDDTTCRWPLGGWDSSPPYLYCGNIVARGCYCRQHASLAYEKPSPPRTRLPFRR